MTQKRSLRTGIFILVILIILTIILAPFGVFSALNIYVLSFVSLVMEKTGVYEGYTTELNELRKTKVRLTGVLKQKEAEIYGLRQQIKQFSGGRDIPSVSHARVIYAKSLFYDPSSAKSRIICNRGAEHGVRKGAVVVSGAYLLGRVISVSASSSTVLLINDMHAAFSVFVGKKRLSGIIKGKGKGHRLIVRYIDNQPENTVVRGDIVETSGFSEGIPPNIIIGEVYNDPEEATATYDDFIRIEVKPYVNLLTVKQVCILVYPPRSSDRKHIR